MCEEADSLTEPTVGNIPPYLTNEINQDLHHCDISSQLTTIEHTHMRQTSIRKQMQLKLCDVPWNQLLVML